jgi:hypothetical protein
MQRLSKQPAFELGQIVATPGALAALRKSGQQPGEFLTRHVSREWGDLSHLRLSSVVIKNGLLMVLYV